MTRMSEEKFAEFLCDRVHGFKKPCLECVEMARVTEVSIVKRERAEAINEAFSKAAAIEEFRVNIASQYGEMITLGRLSLDLIDERERYMRIVREEEEWETTKK